MSSLELNPSSLSQPLSDDEINELAMLLAAQWAPQTTMDVEQLDGFLAGLICAPRVVMPSQYMPVIFGDDGMPEFPDSATMQRFFELLMRRNNQIAEALNAPVERLDDPRAYVPLLVDWRGNADKIQAAGGSELPLPQYGEMWARGFMQAVDLTSEDWDHLPVGDDQATELAEEALDAILALVPEEGEEEAPAVAETEPPAERIERVVDAIWACYDLRDYWREAQFESVRGKVPIRRESKVGRNDPCPCGNGRKFKHCHGRGH